MRVALSVLALILAGASCGDSGPTTPTAIAPGQPFDLQVGTSAATADGALRIRFERVVADSRCPSDVTCVWAGEAVIELSLWIGGSDAETVQLHSAGNPPNQVTRAGYGIRLTAVAPYPRSTVRLKPSDYRITLLASRE